MKSVLEKIAIKNLEITSFLGDTEDLNRIKIYENSSDKQLIEHLNNDPKNRSIINDFNNNLGTPLNNDLIKTLNAYFTDYKLLKELNITEISDSKQDFTSNFFNLNTVLKYVDGDEIKNYVSIMLAHIPQSELNENTTYLFIANNLQHHIFSIDPKPISIIVDDVSEEQKDDFRERRENEYQKYVDSNNKLTNCVKSILDISKGVVKFIGSANLLIKCTAVGGFLGVGVVFLKVGSSYLLAETSKEMKTDNLYTPPFEPIKKDKPKWDDVINAVNLLIKTLKDFYF